MASVVIFRQSTSIAFCCDPVLALHAYAACTLQVMTADSRMPALICHEITSCLEIILTMQASSMATQQGSAASQAGNFGGTYGGAAGQQQSGAYGIAAAEQPAAASRYGQSAQPQTSPYNQPNASQFGQEMPAFGSQQAAAGQPTSVYGLQQQPAPASAYGSQQTSSTGFAGQQTGVSQQPAYGAQQAASPYAAQQTSAMDYAPSASLTAATGYGAQQQPSGAGGYGAQQPASQFRQQDDVATGEYATGMQGVAAYGSNARRPITNTSYDGPQPGASYQQQMPAAASGSQQQYAGSSAAGASCVSGGHRPDRLWCLHYPHLVSRAPVAFSCTVATQWCCEVVFIGAGTPY